MHARLLPATGWPSETPRWLLALVLMLGGAAVAQDDSVAQASLGRNVFVAGAAPVVREPVDGDLFAAGGNVVIDAAVAGDVLAGGGSLRVDGAVGGSLQAAGGRVTVLGTIGRSARVAAGEIELGPQSVVGGNLWMAGGQLRLLGTVRGDVHVAGGRVLVDGTIDGDVVAASGDLALGPHARIAGVLRHSGGTLRRDEAAQVGGGTLAWPGWRGERPPAAHRSAPAFGWGWALALAILAALWLALAPRFLARVGRALQQRPVASVALGLAWLICAPLVLLVLLVTVIGLPLTLLGALLYVLLLPLAYVSTAIALGDAALRSWAGRAEPSWGWRAAAAALLLVGLWQATRLPWIGAALSALALLAGLGALALQVRGKPAG